jgi:C4-dicarboxylate transporter DctQ subunit
MSSSPVLSDSSALSRFDRAYFKIESAMNLAAGITIFALVVLAVVHVISRKLLLGLSYCQREGGHIRMDIVIGQLHRRPLWIAEFLSILFMLFVVTALVYGTYFHFERSFDFARPRWSSDSSIDIGLPLWPAKLVVTVSMAVLWGRLVLQLWGFGRAYRRNEEKPVAVPLVMDATEQAMAEAEAMDGADG